MRPAGLRSGPSVRPKTSWTSRRHPRPADSPPNLVHGSTGSLDDSFVARPLRIGAAWGWRFIVLAVVLWGVLQLIGLLAIVVIPLVIALLLTALLGPAVGRLRKAGVHGSLATAIVLVGGIAAVVGTLTLVVNAFIDGLPKLTENASNGLVQIQDWLKTRSAAPDRPAAQQCRRPASGAGHRQPGHADRRSDQDRVDRAGDPQRHVPRDLRALLLHARRPADLEVQPQLRARQARGSRSTGPASPPGGR